MSGWMPEIDHEPREKRPTWTIWWIAWGIVAFFWIAVGYRFGFNWQQLALGFITGGLLTAWAITITGDKPSSLLRRDRRD